eukprot:9500781-Pyramimonas_sp.AAC.1
MIPRPPPTPPPPPFSSSLSSFSSPSSSSSSSFGSILDGREQLRRLEGRLLPLGLLRGLEVA